LSCCKNLAGRSLLGLEQNLSGNVLVLAFLYSVGGELNQVFYIFAGLFILGVPFAFGSGKDDSDGCKKKLQRQWRTSTDPTSRIYQVGPQGFDDLKADGRLPANLPYDGLERASQIKPHGHYDKKK
jgi:hypothetical protein